jgi:hypothetical protein
MEQVIIKFSLITYKSSPHGVSVLLYFWVVSLTPLVSLKNSEGTSVGGGIQRAWRSLRLQNCRVPATVAGIWLIWRVMQWVRSWGNTSQGAHDEE